MAVVTGRTEGDTGSARAGGIPGQAAPGTPPDIPDAPGADGPGPTGPGPDDSGPDAPVPPGRGGSANRSR